MLFGLLFAVLAGYVVSLIARPAGDSHPWLDGWGVAGFELLAAGLIVARGAVDRGARTYAVLIGLGGCSWALGDVINTYMSVHGESPASPALFNFFWAGFFPLAYVGVMVLMNREVVKITAANHLDGLLVLLVSSAALVALLFTPIRHAAGGDTATVATNLVYPALDVPLVVVSAFGLALSPANYRTRWYLLASAVVANTVGDGVAVFPTLAGGQLGNVLNAAAWPTSLLLIASALWLTPRPDHVARENNAQGFLVPAVASCLAFALLFVGTVSHVNRVGMSLALLAMTVAGARFGLALRHLRRVTEERERELQDAARQEQEAREELEAAAGELRTRSEGEVFGRQLGAAFEMADEEDGAFAVVEQAILEISTATPAELLLADSSQAHLRCVASSPAAGPAGCSVATPFGCAAVRRGQPTVFESSEALDACPKLRGRESGPCSALCVPVNFMGKALGVLHVTGPVGSPPAGREKADIETLAAQAGTRIGTLRAFEKTQLQASTDGLTGLINRRTLESRIGELLHAETPFALAVADLDKFKAVNDTYGHEAGDRALRLFAQVAAAGIRDGDLLARWGGEEFTLVLRGVDRNEAVAVLDRIRASLATAHSGSHPPFTVSFGVTDTTIASSMERLLQIADAGLYESKRSGRDRVTAADALTGNESPVIPAAQERPAVKRNGKGEDTGTRSLSRSRGRTASAGTSNGNGKSPATRARARVPALHRAAEEHEPRPNGFEIR